MQKFENTLWSGKCLSGEMSIRRSVLRGSVRSGNCHFGEMSVGEVSGRGIVISGKCPSGKCQSGKCPVGKLSYNRSDAVVQWLSLLHNSIQLSLNSDSAQVQFLLATCWRFAIVRISGNGSGWKRQKKFWFHALKL